ncbi:MAG: 4-hydroxy-tetrahydrodipicolinate reductase [Flavobacteriaceae bacterium TMED68]|nr:MAG: 4-hydroxy-tetrahydrodipicolinate reductase [Flavobacteriaceae bacterium TMED68]|tara:strand:+ start:2289 stop:2990 length:702 start_codon:yes stop_codon:yes gene_type:complete
MKIALLGYGKMGKMIDSYAKKRKHKISFILDRDYEKGSLTEADVAINFSVPESAVSNIKLALENNIPVVCGTTGWLNRISEIEKFCIKNNSAFLYASNFSIGVNIFFKVNKCLAKLMSPNTPDYYASIEEIHHAEKLDSPSGTAISLAEDIINSTIYEKWELGRHNKKSLKIESIREGDNPGTHSVNYVSQLDEISIKHKAYKRDGFALGAVIAAEWLIDKKGIFNMNDVLKI